MGYGVVYVSQKFCHIASMVHFLSSTTSNMVVIFQIFFPVNTIMAISWRRLCKCKMTTSYGFDVKKGIA